MTQPAFPEPIGPLHYDAPRFVKVKRSKTLTDLSVFAPVFVSVNTREDADKLINAWSEIMQAAVHKIYEILSAENKETDTNGES